MKVSKALAAMLLAVAFAAPAIAQQSNWSSRPYVGLNIGQGSGKGWGDAFAVESVKGGIGGVEAGYNWRKNNVVFGIAGGLSVAGTKGEETNVRTFTSSFDDYTSRTTTTNKVALDRLSTLRGRLGYVVASNWFLYGTGGLAVARVKTETALQLTSTYNGVPSSDTYSYKQVRNATGWVYGGGVAYAVDRDLSVKWEYTKVEMQDMNGGVAVAPLKLVWVGLEYQF